jgi:hypothetical protein
VAAVAVAVAAAAATAEAEAGKRLSPQQGNTSDPLPRGRGFFVPFPGGRFASTLNRNLNFRVSDRYRVQRTGTEIRYSDRCQGQWSGSVRAPWTIW